VTARRKKGLAGQIADLSAAAKKPGFKSTDMPDGLLLMVEPELTVGAVILMPDGGPVPQWIAAKLARALNTFGTDCATEIRQRRLKLSDGIMS